MRKFTRRFCDLFSTGSWLHTQIYQTSFIPSFATFSLLCIFVLYVAASSSFTLTFSILRSRPRRTAAQTQVFNKAALIPATLARIVPGSGTGNQVSSCI